MLPSGTHGLCGKGLSVGISCWSVPPWYGIVFGLRGTFLNLQDTHHTHTLGYGRQHRAWVQPMHAYIAMLYYACGRCLYVVQAWV